jgi:AraC family transcriptional regulator
MRSETATDYTRAIERALAAVFADPALPITVGELATAAGFSAFHFGRVFAGMVGESPGEFLRRLRLERAAHALCAGKDSVTTIAFDSGYESVEAFSRAFRGAFLCPPSVFATTGLAPRLPSPGNLHYDPSGCVPHFTPRPARGEPMDVTIYEDIAPRRILCMRHVGPYWQIGPAFERLHAWCDDHGITPVGPGLAIYHDDPATVLESELRSDACAPVALDVTTDDPAVTRTDLPGGRYAVTSYYGDYSGLGAAWGRFIGEWLPTSAEAIDESRSCFEIYVDLCGTVSPERVRTDLYQPVR